LQHRGQEAAGIVTFDGHRYNSERRLGLVSDHFSKASTIERLPGESAIGHVRYSTTGETILRNVQPLFAELSTGASRSRIMAISPMGFRSAAILCKAAQSISRPPTRKLFFISSRAAGARK